MKTTQRAPPKIPDGMVELMKNLAKSVLKEQPENIYLFAAEYFENLVRERDGSLDKGYSTFRKYDDEIARRRGVFVCPRCNYVLGSENKDQEPSAEPGTSPRNDDENPLDISVNGVAIKAVPRDGKTSKSSKNRQRLETIRSVSMDSAIEDDGKSQSTSPKSNENTAKQSPRSQLGVKEVGAISAVGGLSAIGGALYSKSTENDSKEQVESDAVTPELNDSIVEPISPTKTNTDEDVLDASAQETSISEINTDRTVIEVAPLNNDTKNVDELNETEVIASDQLNSELEINEANDMSSEKIDSPTKEIADDQGIKSAKNQAIVKPLLEPTNLQLEQVKQIDRLRTPESDSGLSEKSFNLNIQETEDAVASEINDIKDDAFIESDKLLSPKDADFDTKSKDDSGIVDVEENLSTRAPPTADGSKISIGRNATQEKDIKTTDEVSIENDVTKEQELHKEDGIDLHKVDDTLPQAEEKSTHPNVENESENANQTEINNNEPSSVSMASESEKHSNIVETNPLPKAGDQSEKSEIEAINVKTEEVKSEPSTEELHQKPTSGNIPSEIQNEQNDSQQSELSTDSVIKEQDSQQIIVKEEEDAKSTKDMAKEDSDAKEASIDKPNTNDITNQSSIANTEEKSDDAVKVEADSDPNHSTQSKDETSNVDPSQSDTQASIDPPQKDETSDKIESRTNEETESIKLSDDRDGSSILHKDKVKIVEENMDEKSKEIDSTKSDDSIESVDPKPSVTIAVEPPSENEESISSHTAADDEDSRSNIQSDENDARQDVISNNDKFVEENLSTRKPRSALDQDDTKQSAQKEMNDEKIPEMESPNTPKEVNDKSEISNKVVDTVIETKVSDATSHEEQKDQQGPLEKSSDIIISEANAGIQNDDKVQANAKIQENEPDIMVTDSQIMDQIEKSSSRPESVKTDVEKMTEKDSTEQVIEKENSKLVETTEIIDESSKETSSEKEESSEHISEGKSSEPGHISEGKSSELGHISEEKSDEVGENQGISKSDENSSRKSSLDQEKVAIKSANSQLTECNLIEKSQNNTESTNLNESNVITEKLIESNLSSNDIDKKPDGIDAVEWEKTLDKIAQNVAEKDANQTKVEVPLLTGDDEEADAILAKENSAKIEESTEKSDTVQDQTRSMSGKSMSGKSKPTSPTAPIEQNASHEKIENKEAVTSAGHTDETVTDPNSDQKSLHAENIDGKTENEKISDENKEIKTVEASNVEPLHEELQTIDINNTEHGAKQDLLPSPIGNADTSVNENANNLSEGVPNENDSEKMIENEQTKPKSPVETVLFDGALELNLPDETAIDVFSTPPETIDDRTAIVDSENIEENVKIESTTNELEANTLDSPQNKSVDSEAKVVKEDELDSKSEHSKGEVIENRNLTTPEVSNSGDEVKVNQTVESTVVNNSNGEYANKENVIKSVEGDDKHDNKIVENTTEQIENGNKSADSKEKPSDENAVKIITTQEHETNDEIQQPRGLHDNDAKSIHDDLGSERSVSAKDDLYEEAETVIVGDESVHDLDLSSNNNLEPQQANESVESDQQITALEIPPTNDNDSIDSTPKQNQMQPDSLENLVDSLDASLEPSVEADSLNIDSLEDKPRSAKSSDTLDTNTDKDIQADEKLNDDNAVDKPSDNQSLKQSQNERTYY